jgi:hypothetical protein
MPATIATAYTPDQMRYLGHQVSSNAMRSWALITNNDNDAELLVLFNSSDTVYRYAFRDWSAANEWDSIRQDDEYEDAAPISWGRCLHRFLSEGAILPIAA